MDAKDWMDATQNGFPWMAECWNLARPMGSPGAGPKFHEPVIITRPEHVWVHPTARIDSFVKLEGGQGLWIGPMVHVASFCHIGAGGGEVILDEACTTASHVVVVSGRSEYGLGKHPSPCHPDFTAKRWRTILGKDAVVFASAVVLGDVPEFGMVPAGTVHKQRRFP